MGTMCISSAVVSTEIVDIERMSSSCGFEFISVLDQEYILI